MNHPEINVNKMHYSCYQHRQVDIHSGHQMGLRHKIKDKSTVVIRDEEKREFGEENVLLLFLWQKIIEAPTQRLFHMDSILST